MQTTLTRPGLQAPSAPARRRSPSEFDFTFYVESRELCIEIECVLDYEPEEGDGWHMPRTPARATLVSAKLGEVEILDGLTADQVKAIEHDALVWHGEEMADRAAEAAWERHQSRD